MHTAVQIGLGYDQWGNAPELLTEADKRNIDRGRYLRVGGDAPCPGCREAYRLHPQVQGALWLRRGCHQLVKL
ncbi:MULTISPECIES: hypothetical protein [unclassified Mesorhizobium]|uniref:hypothetical protein n=1 Tax=unclassified Mesorhizobium TaxID=325217 RepID=UPI0010940AD1|nr:MULTISPECIES: hypothetical protein [unclassified Mesorhizobium]TGT90892.1 hypothetical protein EN804_06025 [Mesorhizobium sp. M8A.F.Ca.ET.161.01.1.1]TGV43828.1 hypothetical protein EN785_07520 [Mesorhizobium sp. M8A.F.Ca.ET.142.01.1.1]